MENPEEVLQLLERFTKLKQKDIPRELEDYLSFVARTGDTVYRWAIVKHLFREKLVNVITDFHDNTPSIADLPQCPNVDPFNYERMKTTLLERLDAFNSAPFTVQRICELLTEPRKQYTRIDKFMRAVEKNILVVSTQEPGRRRSDSENGDSLDSIVNGDLEVNVDIEMDNEAFGIDSNEIVQNSSISTEAAVPVEEAETTATSVPEPASLSGEEENTSSSPSSVLPSEQEKATAGIETTAEQATNGEDTSPDSDSKLEQDANVAAIAIDNTKSSFEDKPVAHKEVTDDLDTLEVKAEDEGVASEDDKLVPNELAPKSIDSVPLNTSDHINSTEPSRDIDANVPQEVSESQANDTVKELKEPSLNVADDNTINKSDENSTDDGQPQAKLAKLSEEPLHAAVANVDSVKNEKTDISLDLASDSGTSSSSSNTSIESESALLSNDTSTSKSDELIPSTATVIETAQISETEQHHEPNNDTSEKTQIQPVAVLSSNESQTETVPEIAVPLPVVEEAADAEDTLPKVTTIEVKQLEEQSTPTVYQVGPDEMETASSTTAVLAENVMATDEEETVNVLVPDTVVPMAADLTDNTNKPDDNAMDVDESSVEPMDQ